MDLVRKSISAQRLRYEDAKLQLDRQRITRTKPKPAKEYLGRYVFGKTRYFLDVLESDRSDRLLLQFMGRSDQVYKL